MDFPYGETVTVLRAVAVADPYSGESSALDWSDPAERDYPLCGVASGPTAEPLEAARSRVESDFTVYGPAGMDVTAADRLRIRGLVCEVVGRPFDWVNPLTGWAAGTAVNANVVEG